MDTLNEQRSVYFMNWMRKVQKTQRVEAKRQYIGWRIRCLQSQITPYTYLFSVGIGFAAGWYGLLLLG